MGDTSDQLGVCPLCERTGSVGEPCDEPVCARRRMHFVPAGLLHAASQHKRRGLDPLIGTTVGDYLIVQRIGAGGFGKVYLAFQLPVRRRPLRVALKLMDDDPLDPFRAKMLLDKFEGEADALAALTHPNIVRLLKHGVHEGVPFLVMEYVAAGRTLREEIVARVRARAPLPRAEARHILTQLLNGLQAAHAQDIVHRDIKPDNVMLQEVAGDRCFVRILDFGLAKFVDERSDTSMAIGTPMFMAPEQVMRTSIGPWTDLYAVGVLCFELLTGVRPFAGRTQMEVFAAKVDAGRDPVARLASLGVAVHDELKVFLRKALHPDPELRFRAAHAMRAALDATLSALDAAGVALEGADLSGLVTEEDVAAADSAPTGGRAAYLPGSFDPTRATPHQEPTPTTPARFPGAEPAPAPAPAAPPATAAAADEPAAFEAEGEPAGVLQRLAARPWVRGGAVAAVALALFLLGAAYIQLGETPRLVTFAVVGGAEVRAGHAAVLRVRAEAPDGREAPVAVSRVRVDGEQAQAQVSRGAPATVAVQVPSRAAGSVELTLHLEADGRAEDVRLTLPVADPAAPPPRRAPGPLPPVVTPHRVELRPEAGRLAAGMENRVFVRVTDAAGAPVAAARVTVTHAALPRPVQRQTDAAGLTDFVLPKASQPSYRFQVAVADPAGRETATEALLGTEGRQMLLALADSVHRPGRAILAELRTWAPEAAVTCELLLGRVILWSAAVASRQHVAPVALPPQAPGLYQLQCYAHPERPGEAFATLPLLVADGDPLPALLAEVRSRGAAPAAGLVAPVGADERTGGAYWLAVLREDPTPPEVLLATRGDDLAALEADRAASRTRILAALGGVFLLFVIWLADGAMKSVLETRERLRAAGLDAGPDPRGRRRLLRARGMLLAAVAVGAVVLNAVAFVWLVTLLL